VLEYQLHDNDLMCPEAVCEALSNQLKMLSKFSDLAAESLKNNRATQSSMDITESTAIVRNECK
jgi:hypothetical protein